ncbi:MAG: 4-alpha-glucanotransferase [Ignavibacteria bacterium]|nr:4-alpha-glucanotransferase [Ignavibacteria bacterium]
MSEGYKWLLNTFNSAKWQKIGTERRAGVCVPLFSVHSHKSSGIGEIPDLKLLIDWCGSAGLSVLQLLPLNDTGFDFSPYNAVSTFAIDPMYIRLGNIKDAELRKYRSAISKLKREFPAGKERVDYGIKSSKMELLRKIYDSAGTGSDSFRNYVSANIHWLKYYALFKVLTSLNSGKEWMDWDIAYKYLSPANLLRLSEIHKREIEFHYWVQWQLFEQLQTVREYARRKNVFIMGDLPFLVSRNSADVWAYKNYFKLGLSSGAPPDMYFAKGQKWGMPPYDWGHISADNYGYIRARLRYAENFYDMYRIDHFVGLFRVWTMNASNNESGEPEGAFDPPDESVWDIHGREIIRIMCESSGMLPCAEDLGTVPDCSPPALRDFGITGMNVQRWEKSGNGFGSFLPADEYRENSIAVISTHDSSSFPEWYEKEAGTVDATAFSSLCRAKGYGKESIEVLTEMLFEPAENSDRLQWRKEISNVFVLMQAFGKPFDEISDVAGLYLLSYNEKKAFADYIGASSASGKVTVSLIKKNLKKIFSANSIFSIQLLSEYLFTDSKIVRSMKYHRINSPGTISSLNWSSVIPLSLEQIIESGVSATVRQIALSSGRR